MRHNFLVYNFSTKNIQIIKSENFQAVFKTLFKKEKKNGITDGYIHCPYEDYMKEAIFWDKNTGKGPVYDIALFEKISIDIQGLSS